MGDILLSVKQLGLKSAGAALPLLHSIEFELKKGEAIGILGLSGSGKTLLTRALVGLLPEGFSYTKDSEIIWKGQSWLAMSEEARTQKRGREIALLPQESLSLLNPVRSIEAQLRDCEQVPKSGRKAQLEHWCQQLEKLGFADPLAVLSAYPHELSGGMRQRVCMMMLLELQPDLILADEPTTALDSIRQKAWIALLKDYQQLRGLSLIHISHDLLCLIQSVDRILILDQGTLSESLPTKELWKIQSSPFLNKLLSAYGRDDEPTPG